MIKRNLVYTITKHNYTYNKLNSIFENHPEIKFVSFMGIDLLGNSIDQRIPIGVFIENLEKVLSGQCVLQTDGSSVAFKGLVSLNDAQVDIIPDIDRNWHVEYNYDNIISTAYNHNHSISSDAETNIKSVPVGTLIIPCYLYHKGKAIDSRSILKNAMDMFTKDILDIVKNDSDILKSYNISADDIKELIPTTATELEFWVKTPHEKANEELLSASQCLKEQYWSKLRGDIKTATERVLMVMDWYGLEPEMGHKEVGGIRASIEMNGKFNHIMEQIEIDWKYSNPLQALDNEYLVKNIIREEFNKLGLEVTFMAKTILR